MIEGEKNAELAGILFVAGVEYEHWEDSLKIFVIERVLKTQLSEREMLFAVMTPGKKKGEL